MKGIDIILVVLFVILWIFFGFLTALMVSGIASIILVGIFNLDK